MYRNDIVKQRNHDHIICWGNPSTAWTTQQHLCCIYVLLSSHSEPQNHVNHVSQNFIMNLSIQVGNNNINNCCNTLTFLLHRHNNNMCINKSHFNSLYLINYVRAFSLSPCGNTSNYFTVGAGNNFIIGMVGMYKNVICMQFC